MGIRLRGLYYAFNASGKDITTMMMGSSTSGIFTTGEELNPKEQAEEKYHAVMREVAIPYKATVWRVCLYDNPKQDNIGETIRALDDLYKAFRRVDRKDENTV